VGKKEENNLFPLPSILEGRGCSGGVYQALSDQANCTAEGRRGGVGVLASLLVVAGLGGACVLGGGGAGGGRIAVAVRNQIW
jgi:hypothetical protein